MSCTFWLLSLNLLASVSYAARVKRDMRDIRAIHTGDHTNTEDKQDEPQPTATNTTDDLISEYYDTSMGIGFSMLSAKRGDWDWTWGLVSEPGGKDACNNTANLKCLSIVTHRQDMSTYRNSPYGLAFHISPKYDFWKYFQVKKNGEILGGPGDGGGGGGHIHGQAPVAMGKDYAWFTKEKNSILARYNTVYHIHDYNEFITNGLAKSALAGIFHYTRGSRNPENVPSDESMCGFLVRNMGGVGRWPVYAYDRESLRIERYLDCRTISLSDCPEEES